MKKGNTVYYFPFLPVLTLIFITLKLTGHITWSWWYVLLPIWGAIPLFVIFFVVAFLFLLIKDLLK